MLCFLQLSLSVECAAAHLAVQFGSTGSQCQAHSDESRFMLSNGQRPSHVDIVSCSPLDTIATAILGCICLQPTNLFLGLQSWQVMLIKGNGLQGTALLPTALP